MDTLPNPEATFKDVMCGSLAAQNTPMASMSALRNPEVAFLAPISAFLQPRIAFIDAKTAGAGFPRAVLAAIETIPV